MRANVLVVDDEKLIRSSLGTALSDMGHDVVLAAGLKESLAVMSSQRFELAIVDLKLNDGSGMDVLRRLRADAPETQVIVITAHGSIETAVEAIKLGAFDFVKKPFELDELLATAKNALKTTMLERRLAYHDARERSISEDEALPSVAPSMQRIESEILTFAAQPIPILLVVGETGSGKALVARRLHYGSARADGPFVELNAAAIPDTLIESELFGHERGAFSDARERKLGLVEVADGGTLLLDEIGELAAGAQAKLLTFLESFSFRRVGGTTMRRVDVRVVAATNRDLAEMVKQGTFRADLFYRINAITILLPPLRERREDIPNLAAHFVVSDAQRYRKRFRGLTSEAAAVLAAWRWPGNVRELKAVIQRAVLMHEGELLDVQMLPPELVENAIEPLPRPVETTSAAHIPSLQEVELHHMRAVLALCGGNKVRAAEHLGISRQTLARRLGEPE